MKIIFSLYGKWNGIKHRRQKKNFCLDVRGTLYNQYGTDMRRTDVYIFKDSVVRECFQ